MRKHGVAVFGQACVTMAEHMPHAKANPTPQNMTIRSNRPAHTPDHKSAWNYNYTNTLPPMLILYAACTKLQTTFSIGLEPQSQWFQKRDPKVQKHRVLMQFLWPMGLLSSGAIWGRGDNQASPGELAATVTLRLQVPPRSLEVLPS